MLHSIINGVFTSQIAKKIIINLWMMIFVSSGRLDKGKIEMINSFLYYCKQPQIVTLLQFWS